MHETYEVSKDLEAKIVTEQKRIAEIARQAEIARKAAASAKQRLKLQQEQNSGGGSSSSYLPPVSNGTWTKPASGTYTSSFGWRTHPIYGTQRQHRGADIANSTGTSVVSAGDGVVSHAGPMGTYGNVIMVTHSIDGQIFTTVYAHLSSINTSAGQQVAKGQFIGKNRNYRRIDWASPPFRNAYWKLVCIWTKCRESVTLCIILTNCVRLKTGADFFCFYKLE